MNPSRYLPQFTRLADVKSHYKLVGDCLLVEQIPVEKEKKTAGGIIMQTSISGLTNTLDKDAPVFAHVLAVGEGFYDEDGHDVPNTVEPGDIILIGPTSTRWFSLFEISNYEAYQIGITRESEVQLVYKGFEGYRKVIGALNQGSGM